MAELEPFSDIVRVQPFAGLVIDPSTWGAGHDYHRSHHRLHLLSMHGSGIASGLTEVPTDPPSDAVYLAIQHVEAAPLRVDGAPDDDPQEARGRVVEAHRIAALGEPPQAPALELARVALEGSGALAVTAARNPWAPGANEIDGRHRAAGGGEAPLEVRVGLVTGAAGDAGEPGTDHARGFSHLLRACAFAGVRATPVFAADGEVPEADLLYVTGHAEAKPSKRLVDGLREQLVGGSWLFADGCGAGETFVDGLQPLLEAAPAAPGDGQAEALVACARYVFGAPPPGACEGELRWGSRAVLSSRDYGCAWQGRLQQRSVAARADPRRPRVRRERRRVRWRIRAIAIAFVPARRGTAARPRAGAARSPGGSRWYAVAAGRTWERKR